MEARLEMRTAWRSPAPAIAKSMGCSSLVFRAVVKPASGLARVVNSTILVEQALDFAMSYLRTTMACILLIQAAIPSLETT